MLFYLSIIESINADWYEEKTVLNNTTNDFVNDTTSDTVNDTMNDTVNITTVNYTNAMSPVYGVLLLPKKLERQCVVCHSPQQRRRSRTVCVKCEKGLHIKCATFHKCRKY